jgi:hypothetical protein
MSSNFDYTKYNGNYLGIVIQNNDPMKRGRVKVYVPHISPTVYSKWNEVPEDKRFKFLGVNTNSDLSSIIDDLKIILPWADLATPLVGESSSGRFNAFNNLGTTSDSSNLNSTYSSLTSNDINKNNLNKYSPNLDGIGEKPGNIYDIDWYKLKDAFSNPKETNVNNANKLSYNYKPEVYSNCAKGSFPVISVGAHVWVFFNDGDPLKPVIFGTYYGSEDWKGIFNINNTDNPGLTAVKDQGIDYPGQFENNSLPLKYNEESERYESDEYNINTETYRNKYVINQKGGTLAFINTDNREALKLSHYSGSFKEFNNTANIELATNNDQKLILNDQFLTVRGNRNEFTQQDYDNVVQGDVYRKIGNLNYDAFKNWYKEIEEIGNVKQLFEKQRCEPCTTLNGINLTSTLQKKVGEPKECPVCNSSDTRYYNYNNSTTPEFVNFIGKGISNSSVDSLYKGFDGLGTIIQAVSFLGNLGQAKIVTALDSIGSVDNSPGKIFGMTCPACGSTSQKGRSPSSMDGLWQDSNKQTLLDNLYRNKAKKFAEIEQLMGLGGSEIVEITKHKIETIGMVMNKLPSIRVDMKGKMYISEVVVGDYGVYNNRTASPLIEQVHVDDLPGGTYTLNVNNKYNLLVGAGGINIKSYGVANIGGMLTNITGEQINIGSELETNIDAGKRLSIVADIINIRQRDKKQIVIEGSLGVTNNVVIQGGLHVEGELTCHHITIPKAAHNTKPQTVYAAPDTDIANLNGPIIGFGVPMAVSPIPYTKGKGTFWKPIGAFDTNPQGAPYIGYTDSSRACGRIQADSTIGYIPGGSFIGVIPIGGIQLATPAGPAINTTTIPVYADKSGTGNGIALPVPGPTTDITLFASALGTKTGATDVGVLGTGKLGFVNTNGSGTGPAPIDGDGCIKGSWIANDPASPSMSPEMMPIILYGTGRDENCIRVADHSHNIAGMSVSLKETTREVREVAGSPIPGSVANAPQDRGSTLTGLLG